MFLSKIKIRLSLKRSAALVGLALLISVKLTGILSAQSVTKGYGSDETLQRGMIVGIVKSNTSKVESIAISELDTVLGVVVNQSDSPITVSSSSQSIFVATSGQYDVLVSDQQGTVNKLDYVTLSSVEGIGMKANELQKTILGRATTSFDGKTNILSSVVLKDGKGNEKTVRIGRVRVDISISQNPQLKSVSGAPAFLASAGNAVSGKSVSAIRLYLGALVFLVGTLTAGAMLYASVRSSIISVGRNPLSKKSIYKSMTSVALASLVVFIVSLLAVYLILKL